MGSRVELVNRDDAREAITSGDLGKDIVEIQTVSYIEKSSGLVQQEHARSL